MLSDLELEIVGRHPPAEDVVDHFVTMLPPPGAGHHGTGPGQHAVSVFLTFSEKSHSQDPICEFCMLLVRWSNPKPLVWENASFHRRPAIRASKIQIFPPLRGLGRGTPKPAPMTCGGKIAHGGVYGKCISK